ncbi:MAG: fatty acid desaturase, partial [Planktomarina sp.]
RTYAEHQAHDKIGARSVIIEDRGPLALLFLNNNYHALHHMHPAVPWYALPSLYQDRKDRVLRRNHGYRFSSYASLIRQYLWRAKEPVIHPDYQDPHNRD